jgi:hypothetical protein
MYRDNKTTVQSQREEIDQYCLSLIGKYVSYKYPGEQEVIRHYKLLNYDGNRIIVSSEQEGNFNIILHNVSGLTQCNCTRCRSAKEEKKRMDLVYTGDFDLPKSGSGVQSPQDNDVNIQFSLSKFE